jgi:hypothetical protein
VLVPLSGIAYFLFSRKESEKKYLKEIYLIRAKRTTQQMRSISKKYPVQQNCRCKALWLRAKKATAPNHCFAKWAVNKGY